MDIYTNGNWCFVPHGKKQMLAIATREEVDQAKPDELGQMVIHALATAKYTEIKKSPRVLN